MRTESEKLFDTAFIKSSIWWKENINPLLPQEIQAKIKSFKKFEHYYTNDKYFVKINNEEFDITSYVKNVKIKNIFDFYEIEN